METAGDDVLKGEFEKDYYLRLREFLKREYSTRVIYPDMYDIFNALRLTPYEDVKAVILGQDPYHQRDRLTACAFSVKKGVPKPPSLVNIFTELEEDTGIKPPDHGNLEGWAKSGVLLLNTVLTVRRGSPNSHRGKGWEIFTDRVIKLLSEREKPMVFILWGGNAKSKERLINTRHCVLKGAHPSPLSNRYTYREGVTFRGQTNFSSQRDRSLWIGIRSRSEERI